MLVEKAARKGRTQAEVDEIIGWLTGYSVPQIEAAVQNGTLYGDFFRDAPQLNPDRVLIKGSICNVKLESIEEPLMKEIRYLESWWMSWLRAKRWRRSSGQTNEEKQPIIHRQRMWYNP